MLIFSGQTREVFRVSTAGIGLISWSLFERPNSVSVLLPVVGCARSRACSFRPKQITWSIKINIDFPGNDVFCLSYCLGNLCKHDENELNNADWQCCTRPHCLI